ncbi:MAG: hypothetical protein HYU67_13845 [Flavobacteriia bacterium]|nr:hypothetical protein [Flavobacteriia bacterium]
MKKCSLLILSLLSGFYIISQTQIDNNGFELWDNVGSTSEEPNNWNGFKTASGTWNSFGSQQVIRSTDVRPNSNGLYSAQLWTKNVTVAIANGNLTLGRINMGSTTPTSAENYNYSQTDDVLFSETLTQIPDSLVFWVKFIPINIDHEARVSCVIHDNVEFKDPNDVGNSNVVAQAIQNFPLTNGNWIRKSIPFTKFTNTNAQFILLTFTTNKDPGVGTDNGSEFTRDNLWIDDVELIYPNNSLNEVINNFPIITYNEGNTLIIKNNKSTANQIIIIGNNGAVVYENASLNQTLKLNLEKGIYFVQIVNENGQFVKKCIVF